MQQKHHYNSHIGWIVTLVGAAMLLLFFLLFYPYHLRHREQTMLFLLNIDWIRATYLSLEHGGLVRLVGDFVQQFFYYIGAGPVILSILVTLLGVVWYRIVMRIRTLFRLRGGGHEPREEAADVRDGRAGLWKFGAYAFAILVVLWEAGRECLPQYPLASTLQVLGWSTILLLALRCKDRPMAAWTLGIGIIAGCWLLDYEMLPGAKLFGKPNMTVEHLMGLDVEASFGHWTKVEHLTEDDTPNTVDIFYRNLSLAYQNRLPEAMMTRRQNGEEGLFIPVNENGNYFFFGAAGEAWWAVGDMTMAEHATLLAQIFSPRKMGSRYMKRLAEINLSKGDRVAADKYLRMLEQSLVHRKWALEKKNDECPNVLDLPTSDTLRLTGEVRLCLRSTLDRRPGNAMALQYLLCYDLLVRDLLSFTDDVQRYGCPRDVRLYEEAMLVVMASRHELREAWQPLVRRQTYEDFEAFNQALIESKGHLDKIRPAFGKTYWYYLRQKKL